MGGEPEAEAEAEGEPSGFETQRLDVPIPADLVEEDQPAMAGAQDGMETGRDTAGRPPKETGSERIDEIHEEPASDAPSDETPQDVADVHEDSASEQDLNQRADQVLTVVEAGTDFGEGEEGEEEEEEAEGARWEGTKGEPVSSSGTQEPKWLFSLLKREEGEVPGGGVEDEPKEEV
jgi:hypothetical protein